MVIVISLKNIYRQYVSLEVLEAYDFRISRRKTKYIENFYRTVVRPKMLHET